MLTLSQVTKRYPTGDRALTDIDLTLPRGQVMALIGPSGAGKSTLIRCVNRLVEPTSGSIRLEEGADPSLRQRPAPGASGHGHDLPGVRPGGSPDGHGERALRPARLRGLLAQLPAPLPRR